MRWWGVVHLLDCVDGALVDVDYGKRGARDSLDGGEKVNDDGVEGRHRGGICGKARRGIWGLTNN